MSKFRARQLDASKPIPIYFQEDISDSTEFNNVTNRTVPQLPTGMEKEEETEHHLQQAIFHHRVIPVPEVYNTEDEEKSIITYDKLYPATCKMGRQMIHIHPFSTDQDIPDYDLDSEDEEWLQEHTRKGELLPLDPLQFEEMMDRLEKASGLKAVTLQEAKLLLKDDDDLITAVYDYWLNKRLRLQHPLIPQPFALLQVKSEKGVGSAPTDPYVAFRKRTEKMQTRKNRKNDETSYEKMLKLRRDLLRAVTLLEMVKRREKAKRELLHLNIELHEKRYELEDFSGTILNEITSQRLNQQQILQRPAFTPIIPNHQIGGPDQEVGGLGPGGNMWLKVPPISRTSKEEGKRERRPYKKKRKHLQVTSTTACSTSSSTSSQHPRPYVHPPDPYSIASVYPQHSHMIVGTPYLQQTGVSCAVGVSEDDVASHSEAEDENSLDGYFAFRRKPFVDYHAPREASDPHIEGNPLFSPGVSTPKNHQYYLTSISHPVERVIGLARRRIGRGGRIWLDRIRHPFEDLRIKAEGKDTGPNGLKSSADIMHDIKIECPHYRPSAVPTTTCADVSEDSEDAEVDVETVSGGLAVPLAPPTSSAPSSLVEDAGGGGGLVKDVPTGGSLSSSSTNSSCYASSFYVTAEVLEGAQEGSFTDLHVSLPPLEDIAGVLSVVEEEGDELDLLPAEGRGGKVSSLTHSLSDALTPVSLSNSGGAAVDSGGVMKALGISSSTKWTLTNSVMAACSKVGNGSSSSSSSISVNNSSSSLSRSYSSSWHHQQPQQHSTTSLDFQTQPSSKFFTSDTTTCPLLPPTHLGGRTSHQHQQPSSTSQLVTGDDSLKLGISPLSSCPPSSSSCNFNSYNNINNNSGTLLQQQQQQGSSASILQSSSSSSSLSSSSTSSSFSRSLVTVSSSLATSLSNSLSCASSNLPTTTTCISTSTTLSTPKSIDDPSLQQEQNSKKLPNISSLYFRQAKLDSLSSGILLSNNKSNGNNVLNSNSNLVSQKILTWTNDTLSSEENTNAVITNGPSSKSLDNLKCAKVTPILFPET